VGIVEPGAVDAGALAGGLVEGAGDGCEAGLWAIEKQLTTRQSVKTAAMRLFMGNNLTPILHVRKQK
jgi:hypothetical protein